MITGYEVSGIAVRQSDEFIVITENGADPVHIHADYAMLVADLIRKLHPLAEKVASNQPDHK